MTFLGSILVGFAVFFLIIALTIILGSISRKGDRRVALEGRATPDQRLPTEREAHGYT